MVAGGVESISPGADQCRRELAGALDQRAQAGDLLAMIETADIVAERYGVSREAQDDYGLRSQQRIAAAQQAGLFDDEIVPMQTTMAVKDKRDRRGLQQAGHG